MNRKGKSAIQNLKNKVKNGETTPSRPTSKQLAEMAMTAAEWDRAARESQDAHRAYTGSPTEKEHKNNAKGMIGKRKP